jgi:hypothetical protein
MRAGVPDLKAERTRPGETATLPLVMADRPRAMMGLLSLLNLERRVAATLPRPSFRG